MQNLLFGVYLLISYFQAEYLKINKNEQKGSLILQYSFTQKTRSLYKTQLAQHCKKYTPVTQPKNLLILQILLHTCSGWCQKKHLHCTICRRPRTAFSKHLETKYLYIPVYCSKKIFVPEI